MCSCGFGGHDHAEHREHQCAGDPGSHLRPRGPSHRRGDDTGNVLVRRTAGVLVGAVVLLLLAAAPAGAHAELVQSDPAPGAVLARPPEQVKLTFTEDVDVTGGAIRVFDADAERVDSGGVESTGRTVTLPLPSLDDGSYVVTWRVTSTDAHPIRGAFTFQVGQGGAGATSREVQGLADRLLAEQGGDQVVGAVYGARASWCSRVSRS